MKVVSTDALTKLIQLIKGTYIANTDTVATNEVTLATVATTGAYSDLSGTPTIPTVNNSEIVFTQGGVNKGSFTLNQATGATIALDTGGGGGGSYTAGTGIDITNDTISVTAPTLTNTSNSSVSLSILGSTSGTYGTAIGYGASAGGWCVSVGTSATSSNSSVSIGYNSEASGSSSVAIGYGATATGSSSIQLGRNSNSEANSFYVATSTSNNWKMLGSDGLIPAARLPIATSVSSSSTNSETVGAKLFYDTIGDVETLLQGLR